MSTHVDHTKEMRRSGLGSVSKRMVTKGIIRHGKEQELLRVLCGMTNEEISSHLNVKLKSRGYDYKKTVLKYLRKCIDKINQATAAAAVLSDDDVDQQVMSLIKQFAKLSL